MSIVYGSKEYKKVMAVIAEKLEVAYNAISEAEAIADNAGVSFSFDIGVYGAGASYDGEEKKWYASSQSC